MEWEVIINPFFFDAENDVIQVRWKNEGKTLEQREAVCFDLRMQRF